MINVNFVRCIKNELYSIKACCNWGCVGSVPFKLIIRPNYCIQSYYRAKNAAQIGVSASTASDGLKGIGLCCLPSRGEGSLR